jgi:hypothetical protein
MQPSVSVNRTTLHPQGVKPHVPHSQIEEVYNYETSMLNPFFVGIARQGKYRL